jgi:hypothetical protein
MGMTLTRLFYQTIHVYSLDKAIAERVEIVYSQYYWHFDLDNITQKIFVRELDLTRTSNIENSIGGICKLVHGLTYC